MPTTLPFRSHAAVFSKSDLAVLSDWASRALAYRVFVYADGNGTVAVDERGEFVLIVLARFGGPRSDDTTRRLRVRPRHGAWSVEDEDGPTRLFGSLSDALEGIQSIAWPRSIDGLPASDARLPDELGSATP